MKVLIIRFSSIGDIVLTTPVIRCLKLQKDAEIHYLTKASFASILTVNPYISKVYSIQKSTWEVLPQLKAERYDYIIDLHHNLRTFLLKFRLPPIRSFAFEKLNIEKALLTTFKINRLPKKHIVDRYLATVKPLGVENDGVGLDYFLDKEAVKLTPVDINQIETLLPQNKYFPSFKNVVYLIKKEQLRNYIALPIGAGKKTKAMTVEKIITICKSVKYPIILLGGPPDKSKGIAIEDALKFPEYPTSSWETSQEINSFKIPEKKLLINLVGQCSLGESAYLVKNATVVLTADTGLMHIAAAFQKPIVSIWGNTIPEFGMSPYYKQGTNRNHKIEVKNLACRPCSKIGYDGCPQGHFHCIKKLDTQQIVAQLEKIVFTEQ